MTTVQAYLQLFILADKGAKMTMQAKENPHGLVTALFNVVVESMSEEDRKELYEVQQRDARGEPWYDELEKIKM